MAEDVPCEYRAGRTLCRRPRHPRVCEQHLERQSAADGKEGRCAPRSGSGADSCRRSGFREEARSRQAQVRKVLGRNTKVEPAGEFLLWAPLFMTMFLLFVCSR